MNDNEVNLNEDTFEEYMNIDEESIEQGQKGQETDHEGDQDWTPQEAESAYEQVGDDDCKQGPNPKYLYYFCYLYYFHCHCHYIHSIKHATWY